MATIREKGPYQWQVQIRRKGWPYQTATFRTKKDAQAWARKTEREMDQGLFVDQTEGRETTLGDLIELHLEHVTANRPSEHSRVSEGSKLRRFLREERELCAYAAVNLTPDHFEEYRDRRKRARLKNGKQIKPSTVNKELMQLKRVIDYRKRRLGIVVNPVNTQDVKRLPVNDERDVRLSAEEKQRLLEACSELRNPLIRPFVELGFRDGAIAYRRRYKPKLLSEGAPSNQIPFSAIFGLTGLSIESRETADWPSSLSDEEVSLACRYASHELNGFPAWFPQLFEKHPNTVCDFLLNEIRYELSINKTDVETHHILSDVSWSGEWAWDVIAPELMGLIAASEPANLMNLRKLLTIIQGASVTDDEIRIIAAKKM